ncbi:hypothetical protein HDV05_000838 [Chytridiales sp. JEL 0842]|nr:hypothetical protein HDV05_000838 [Chytridiales sp. JEL 0842]
MVDQKGTVEFPKKILTLRHLLKAEGFDRAFNSSNLGDITVHDPSSTSTITTTADSSKSLAEDAEEITQPDPRDPLATPRKRRRTFSNNTTKKQALLPLETEEEDDTMAPTPVPHPPATQERLTENKIAVAKSGTAPFVSGVKYREHVELNPHIAELRGLLKKEITDLMDLCNVVKNWIQLNIPQIEDGHNFGVSIQEDMIKELTTTEDASFSTLESFYKNHASRAKLASKCIKYPHVEDYKQAVRELDEFELVHLKLSLQDCLQGYAVLYDRLTKNWSKIAVPRSLDHHHVTMY